MGSAWEAQKQGSVAVLTMDRPPLNLLRLDDMAELGAHLASLRGDPGIRAIVLTGRGSAFIGGADITTFGGTGPAEAKFALLGGQRVLRDMEEMEKPVVAAVNGYAFGGGCEVALACDIRICAQEARFGQLEINYGIMPGWGGTQRLPRVVGMGLAKDIILTGRTVDAAEAFRIGLVSRVTEGSALMETALEIAGMLASKPPVAIALAKEAINASAECSIPAGGALEADACAITMGTEDCLEGVRAFIEKRMPQFRGR